MYPLSLVVEQKAAPEAVIPLEQIQKLTFSKGVMQLHYTEVTPDYPSSLDLSGVIKCTFSTQKKPTSVMVPVAPRVFCTPTANGILVQGLENGRLYTVSLFNMQGTQLFFTPAFIAGDVIPTAALPNGLYIVAVDNQTCKIIL